MSKMQFTRSEIERGYEALWMQAWCAAAIGNSQVQAAVITTSDASWKSCSVSSPAKEADAAIEALRHRVAGEGNNGN